MPSLIIFSFTQREGAKANSSEHLLVFEIHEKKLARLCYVFS